MKKTKKTPLDHLDDVDVFFDPKPLTKEEKNLLCEAIASYKKKSKKKATKSKEEA